jgi:hypothetical protein
MNWSKALIGGVAAGIAVSVVEFILHGQVMASTYTRYSDVFSQEQANPGYFVFVAVCTMIAAAILFAKTRDSWGAGPMGGATYGFFLGLVAFFSYFYNPLVIDGYPYYLAWCQGSITLIAIVVGGAVMGMMIKRS